MRDWRKMLSCLKVATLLFSLSVKCKCNSRANETSKSNLVRIRNSIAVAIIESFLSINKFIAFYYILIVLETEGDYLFYLIRR